MELHLEKTFKAFLYPDGSAINTEDDLKKHLFDNDTTDYPNGSLLHVKQTNEVFILTHGKKMLIPSPEIFSNFGWSWDNLVDVDQSVTDSLPNTSPYFISLIRPHPAGVIMKAYPSGQYYLIGDSEKYAITSKSLVDEIWNDPQKEYSIAVNDQSDSHTLSCSIPSASLEAGSFDCTFDEYNLVGSIGKSYHFYIDFPRSCDISKIHFTDINMSFVTDKSTTTVKQSLQNIILSLINRYANK
jgi:hypothetical protein